MRGRCSVSCNYFYVHYNDSICDVRSSRESDQGRARGAGAAGELAKGGSSRVSSASANHLSGMSGRKLCPKKVFNESTSKSPFTCKFL